MCGCQGRLILRLPLLLPNQHWLGASLLWIMAPLLLLIRSEPGSVVGTVVKATNGIGVDIAFDAAGSQAGLDSALPSIRPRGVYVDIAIFDGSPRVNMNLIVTREITLVGIFFFFAYICSTS